MNNKIIVFLLPLFFLSCEEEIADEFDCVTLSAELTTGLEAYSSNPADTVSCLSLKAQAADFINNSCDTTGIGDIFCSTFCCTMLKEKDFLWALCFAGGAAQAALENKKIGLEKIPQKGLIENNGAYFYNMIKFRTLS